MKKMITRRQFLKAAGVSAAALGLAACGGSSASTAESTATSTEATSEAAASGSKTDVAFVTDVGNIDDQSFNQYTWQGVQDFCSANSLNANYYRPTEDSDAARLEQMDNAVNDGAKAVVVAGSVPLSLRLRPSTPTLSSWLWTFPPSTWATLPPLRTPL